MVKENERYGKLTTLYISGKTKNRNNIWHCICDCGNEIDVPSGSLTSGNTKSCGCLHKESMRKIGENRRNLNKYDLSGKYGIGYTSDNHVFYFDLDDYDKISKYTWSINPDGYIISMPFGKILRMHILIMNAPKGYDVDHRNHITYDNRKDNLRICEHYQNIISCKTYSNNTSGRKGVSYDKSRNKWIAYIAVNGKNYNLGRFDAFDDAVKAREIAEEKYHKEYHFL